MACPPLPQPPDSPGQPQQASLLLVLLPVTADTQNTITCGALITESVTLTSNLTCTGTALTIASSAPISVDLGDHTVTSTQNLVFDSADWQRDGAVDRHPTIRDNQFIHGACVRIGGFDTATVEDNQFLAGPAGKSAIFTGFSLAGVFSGNMITGYGVGLDLIDLDAAGFSRTVANNTVSGSGTGIRIDGAFGNLGTISGNRVAGNSGDGILIVNAFPFTPGTISGNIALGNGGNGIEVQPLPGPTVHPIPFTFTGNVARGNAGHGIVAPAGAIDGGGNLASGNRTDPQCVNLTCSP